LLQLFAVIAPTAELASNLPLLQWLASGPETIPFVTMQKRFDPETHLTLIDPALEK
jgi:hypothetical protein